MTILTNNNHFLRFSVILLLIAYIMPWLIHSTQTLTLNAFDLAEWTTLHPSSRSASLPLLESFLLRFQIIIILWLMISTITHERVISFTNFLKVAMIVIVSISLLPPIDQITNISDLNYRQQIALALLSLLGAIAISFSSIGWRWSIQVILLALALITALPGIFQAGLLFQSYDLSISIGAGTIAYIVIISCSLVALVITKKG